MKKLFLFVLSTLLLVNVAFAYTGHIFLIGEINDQTQANLENQLAVVSLNAWMHHETITDVVVHITSPGGYVHSSIAIHNWLRYKVASKDVKIHTVANGLCASGAVMVLQAGDVRYAVANTGIYTHNARFMLQKDVVVESKDLSDLRDNMNEANDKQLAIFEKRMKISKLRLSVYFQDDIFKMDPYSAKQLGFIDQVIEVSYNWTTPYKKENK